jgi:hypothetical protein
MSFFRGSFVGARFSGGSERLPPVDHALFVTRKDRQHQAEKFIPPKGRFADAETKAVRVPNLKSAYGERCEASPMAIHSYGIQFWYNLRQ